MGLFNEYSNAIEKIADSYHLSREDSRVVLSCIEFARMNGKENTEAIEQKIKDYLNED